MSVLTVANQCQRRLQIPQTQAFCANTDGNSLLLKAMLEETMRNVCSLHAWPQLVKEYTFTLATGTAAYAFPPDIDRVRFETMWNRSQHWPLIGPLNSQEYQQYKSGNIASFPRQRFMVRGWNSTQFTIDPTPTSSENGQTVVFEYITSYTIRPSQIWTATTSFLSQQYCYYNMNIYDRGGTGAATSGTTPPTHTSGSVSDGGITWTYTGSYNSVAVDSDVFLTDEEDIILGACWRFKRERQQEYEELKRIAEDNLERSMPKLSSAGILNVNGGRLTVPMLGPWSAPEANYGV